MANRVGDGGYEAEDEEDINLRDLAVRGRRGVGNRPFRTLEARSFIYPILATLFIISSQAKKEEASGHAVYV